MTPEPLPGDLPAGETEYLAPSPEERVFHERWLAAAVARIWKITWTLGAAGALLLLALRGWTWSAGWVLGTSVSALNFRWLKQLTEALGSEAAKPRKAVFLGLRYLFLGGGAYVILKYSAISLPAALSGLFVSVAAVILEILFELAYARHGTLPH
ncbi:MAG: ATP synthase subunit I [Candidatus Solibacter sp.]